MRMKDNKIANLTEVIKIATQVGVDTARKEFQQLTLESLKSREDRRLHNTKILLENYKILKMTCAKHVVDIKKSNALDTLEDIEALMDNTKERILESVQKSQARTIAMVGYIEDTLKLYHAYAKHIKKKDELCKYTVMVMLFMSKLSYSNADIAVKLHVDASTISRYKADAIKTYSRFLWGVDSIKLVNFVHKKRT